MLGQMSLFDGSKRFVIDKPIRLIELFAGYGSQHFALEYLGADFESWKVCEWAVKSIQALKHLPKDTEIMNIGYCGSEVFEIGKKLEIIAVKTHHEVADFDEHFMKLNQICKGIDDMAFCYTSTDFVTKVKKQEKDGFWSDCVYDMELAFIRAMFDNVRSIKVVSDNLNKKDYDDYVS